MIGCIAFYVAATNATKCHSDFADTIVVDLSPVWHIVQSIPMGTIQPYRIEALLTSKSVFAAFLALLGAVVGAKRSGSGEKISKRRWQVAEPLRLRPNDCARWLAT